MQKFIQIDNMAPEYYFTLPVPEELRERILAIVSNYPGFKNLYLDFGYSVPLYLPKFYMHVMCQESRRLVHAESVNLETAIAAFESKLSNHFQMKQAA